MVDSELTVSISDCFDAITSVSLTRWSTVNCRLIWLCQKSAIFEKKVVCEPRKWPKMSKVSRGHHSTWYWVTVFIDWHISMHPGDGWENATQSVYLYGLAVTMTFDLLTSKSNLSIFITNCTKSVNLTIPRPPLTHNTSAHQISKKSAMHSWVIDLINGPTHYL